MRSPWATPNDRLPPGSPDEGGMPEGDALGDYNHGGGITPEGLALGHRYVMGHVNAYCPQCSREHSEREGRDICVLDCDYDLDK